MEKTNVIKEITERLGKVEKFMKTPKKDKGKKKADEDVCPECGGDLVFVDQGIVFCPKCNEYYESDLEDLGEEEE